MAQSASLDGYDFDGDGIDDFLVPTVEIDENSDRVGRVGVYSGNGGAILFTLVSGEPNDAFGCSCSAAGDLDGDGVNDIVVGAPYSAVNGWRAGRVYIFSGQ
ncbi:MAG: FG-GAP repeat protein [Phycisphaeraceae bacterium]|nr:FG-GAP repeat protein [Phycisphaeraceae bacterium]MCB9848119.1 FG-GAP repeat protein [Phycisphaeraceae bacterium]